ncbi:uncharacterized protein LOC115445942 [Manduca sexta]|uniref:RIIa domain-containing protein n=1 Tax=Manduca sexta TaxID=7130 RepID=A0A921ZA18_MANSE|nr:uncharacterized protein LOC115445942 [Manduca sexta]KAG6453959.1 hypothetical protein O3G_MSEX008433 [Manduca sexta]
MEDLLQSQIKKSCDLALPNGLKELMWDISREVLRAQPSDIYEFITEYLSVLLVTRENLSVAAKVCNDTCRAPCELVLEDKLKDIGLNDEDVITTRTIIMEHLEGPVNEGSLLLKLIRKTNIDEAMFPALQETIRAAFVNHHGRKMRVFETPDCADEVKEAATHTLKLYETASPSNEEYHRMATRIQAAYRAYGVRRAMCNKKEIKEKSSEIKDKKIKIKEDNTHVEIKEPEKTKSTRNSMRASVTTESSSSLAGSYVKLPKYIPYSAHDVHDLDEEVLEKVHSNTEIEDKMNKSEETFYKENVKERNRTISFEALMIKDDVSEADDESETSVEELIHVEGEDALAGEYCGIDDEAPEIDEYEIDEFEVNESDTIETSGDSNDKLDIKFHFE